MKQPAALLLVLLMIAGCQRSRPEALPADAQGEAQARTSAKGLADIAAAEEAARSQLPVPGDHDAPAETTDRRGKAKVSTSTSEAEDASTAEDFSGNETNSR